MEMTIRINYYDESADNFEYHTLYEEDFQNGRPPIYSLMTEIIDRYEEDEYCGIGSIDIVDEEYDVILSYPNEIDFIEDALSDYKEWLSFQELMKQADGKCLIKRVPKFYEEDEWAKNSYDVIVLQSNKKYCVVFQSRTVAEARKYIAENNLEYFDEKVRHNPYFRRTKVVKNPFHFVWNTANDVDYKR